MLRKVIIDNEPIRRFRNECYENYYMIDDYMEIVEELECNSTKDIDRYNIGNYFKTKEEAKRYKEMLLIKQKLKDLALELNNGEEIDWTNAWSYKYFIGYDYDCGKLGQYNNYVIKNQGQIYCLNENFLEIAIQRIGYVNLVNLIEYGI